MNDGLDPNADPTRQFQLYQDRAGIWRLGLPRGEEVRLPPGFRLEPRPIAVGHVPTFFDQLWSYTTGAELVRHMFPDEPLHLVDRPILGPSDIVEIVRATPLEPGLRLMVWLQRRLYLHGFSREDQLETISRLCAPEFAEAGARMLDEFPRRALFSEQQAFVMQRLLLMHAHERQADDMTTHERARLTWALLWIPDTMLDPELQADREMMGMRVDDERLLRFFVSHGGLATHPALRHELARAHRLYAVLANSRAARRHRDYCPIDDWLREAYGLDFAELQAFGFTCFVRSNVADEADGDLRFASEEYFSNSALGSRYAEALPAIAAPREWYVDEFNRSAAKSRRAAREIQPFLRRPALIQRDGNVVVFGPRAIESWLGASGAYYRIFDLARSRGREDMERFRRFNGFLQERYFRQLAHIVHPHQRRRTDLNASGVVLGEQLYKTRKGELMTNDITVDLGLDLVLIEVTSSRVTMESLVDGDIDAVVRDLTKVVLAKMRQLDRVIRDLVSRTVTLPGVDMTIVQRIWPLIVSPEGLFHSPSLWAWCERNGGHLLQPPPGHRHHVKPLVLLDAEEYEILMSLIADGWSLPAVLSAKTSDVWRERDFKAWILEEKLDSGPDLPFIRQELVRSQKALVRVLRGSQLLGP